MIVEVLKQIGKSVLSSLLTEKFIKEVTLFLLQKLAERTTNSLDDAIVEKVKEALK